MGMKALQRAALKVAEDARKNQYKIPIWRNGRIEYGIPEITSESINDDNITLFDIEDRDA